MCESLDSESLDSFAMRLIGNGEVSKFIDILMEKGCPLTVLYNAVIKHRYTIDEEDEPRCGWKEAKTYVEQFKREK